jgi:hypothetical protein
VSAPGCPRCGGVLPGDPGRVCQCGREWVADPHQLNPDVDWDMVLHLLVVRSGQRCEARTPWCFGKRMGKSGPDGYLHDLTRGQVSIHHRRPRGMGGTDRPDTHTLPNLMLLCGSGTIGCHGFIESHRQVALDRGYLLPKEGPLSVPAARPLVTPGGRLVFLDYAPSYVDTGRYALDVPDWPVAA